MSNLEQVLAKHQVTATGRFVPFSQSRNAGNKDLSLNWKGDLLVRGNVVLKDLDFSQGIANAPSYKQGSVMTIDRDNAIRYEVENGKSYIWYGLDRKKRIEFPAIGFTACIFMDASAIDCLGFSDWASNYGYSDDSIKAKAIYDACVEYGLKLRARLGDAALKEIQDEANQY